MQAINEVGQTAFIIASYRDDEKNNDNPLFIDDYAQHFTSEEMKRKADDFYRIIPEGKEIIRYRTKYFDDILSDRIQQGISQVVLLGSGFDFRASRFFKDGVSFFDIDQEPVLNYKNQIIKENKIHYPSTLVSCNYLEDDIISRLTEKGFDTSLPTIFIWEGNTPYLPESKIHTFLTMLRQSVDKFEIFFDFITKQVVNNTSGKKSVSNIIDFFQNISSPWITGFDDISKLAETVSLDVNNVSRMRSFVPQYMLSDTSYDIDILDMCCVCSLNNNMG